jgi:uncharacterized protein
MKFGIIFVLTCRQVFSIGLVILALFLTGCLRESKSVQFYMLNADSGLAGAPLVSVANQDMVIGLGPIHIPEYLNRPQIIVATSQNQYRLSEHHRWAERLDQNISHALFKALPRQLGTDRIVRYPWSQWHTIDYQVGIDILEFNVNANGQSFLIAQWYVKSKDKPTIDKRSEYQSPASTTDHEIMVKAQSQCLTMLGKEISETLRQLMAVRGRE